MRQRSGSNWIGRWMKTDGCQLITSTKCHSVIRLHDVSRLMKHRRSLRKLSSVIFSFVIFVEKCFNIPTTIDRYKNLQHASLAAMHSNNGNVWFLSLFIHNNIWCFLTCEWEKKYTATESVFQQVNWQHKAHSPWTKHSYRGRNSLLWWLTLAQSIQHKSWRTERQQQQPPLTANRFL